MKTKFTYSTTENYIVDTKDYEETKKLIKAIWEIKQSYQNDLIKQYNIDYTIDVIEQITEQK
tara:strand:+ start:495 stop:680 length:186 start_codon:yes stop_codon:yes gene_type:complete